MANQERIWNPRPCPAHLPSWPFCELYSVWPGTFFYEGPADTRRSCSSLSASSHCMAMTWSWWFLNCPCFVVVDWMPSPEISCFVFGLSDVRNGSILQLFFETLSPVNIIVNDKRQLLVTRAFSFFFTQSSYNSLVTTTRGLQASGISSNCYCE